MSTIQATVGQWVVERPSRARVFERLGIDYCCGGKKPLSDACSEKGIDPQVVLRELAVADQQPAASETDWSKATLTELADHIEATHHAYMKAELPRLEFMVNKVASVHGDHHPELLRVRDIFAAMKTEMDQHMWKEEQILFPLCRQIAAGHTGPSHCGSVANPIRVMIQEHDSAGNALSQMRELTGGFTPPPEACNTYRATLHGLAEMEADLHQHVHKENNILFPRAIAAEGGR